MDEYTDELKQLQQQLQKEKSRCKLVEEKLRTAEMQMRSIFEAMSDIVLIIHTQGSELGSIEILPTNNHSLSTSGTDLVNQTVEQFFEEHTDYKWLEKVRQVVDTQQTLNFDYSLDTTRGVVWFSASISPAGDNYAVWVARDISDRKQVEEFLYQSEAREREKAQQLELTVTKLKKTQSQLIQSEKMSSLGQMVAGIAHEINNPTSFIYGNIQPATHYTQDLLHLIELYQQHYPHPVPEIIAHINAIDLDFIAKDFPKLLKSMEEGSERISEIVQSLRNFSRVDQPERKLIDIHEGIDNTLLILEHRLKKQPQRPEIQVIKEYGQLPKVECYPGQINQVFMNLLGNAMDALEEKFRFGVKGIDADISNYQIPTIHIHTNVIDSKLAIFITDNGTGIKPAIQSKIFDPFYTTKPPGKGTGLGLSICYKIVVEEHGGKIKCHSVVGQGTEFLIELPITQKLSHS